MPGAGLLPKSLIQDKAGDNVEMEKGCFDNVRGRVCLVLESDSAITTGGLMSVDTRDPSRIAIHLYHRIANLQLRLASI